MASKVTYAELVSHMPLLTRYQFTAARRYTLEVGAGLNVQLEAKQIREKVDPTNHFLDFIMSSTIVQDLPFGRKTLTLSSGSKIDLSNDIVIRTVLLSRLIKQYNQYCYEENYTSLSSRTQFRILCLRHAWHARERVYRG